MTLTDDAILGDVTALASSVSRVPATHIVPADTLKVQLGMNRADLVRFANLLTDLCSPFASSCQPADVCEGGDTQSVGMPRRPNATGSAKHYTEPVSP